MTTSLKTVYSATEDNLTAAIELMQSGQPVAFPTETVYGLGAPASMAETVKRIFEIKGRPPSKPLIVHVANSEQAQRVVDDWPETAQRLTDAFWPGPLTLILESHGHVPEAVTAGGSTVAVRCPDHPVAQKLIEQLGEGIAAPSANPSGQPPPTTAEQVASYFSDAVPIVLDGGPCKVKMPSTLLAIDADGRQGRILREGLIVAQQLGSFIDIKR